MQLGVSPDYVLDRIQTYEIQALLNYNWLKSKDEWEQARLIAYVTAQCQSTKKLKITDIIDFPWEKQEKTQKEIKVDKERIKKIQELAQEMIKNNMV